MKLNVVQMKRKKSNYQRKIKIDVFPLQEVVESWNSVLFIYDIDMVDDC